MTVRYGEVIAQNYGTFCQFRSKLAITHTIAIKWKEKYDSVVVDCHHNLCLCGDRMKMSLPKKKKKIFRETPNTPGVPFWEKFRPLWRVFRPSHPLAYSLLPGFIEMVLLSTHKICFGG